MKKILLLSLTLIFAAELEVDGNLKVTGNVDVQNNPIKNVGPPTTLNDAINAQILQDAIRDDGLYEYMFLYLKFIGSGDGITSTQRHIDYLVPTDMDTGDISWSNGGISKINTLILDGWKISARLQTGVGSTSYYIYELKRAIEE